MCITTKQFFYAVVIILKALLKSTFRKSHFAGSILGYDYFFVVIKLIAVFAKTVYYAIKKRLLMLIIRVTTDAIENISSLGKFTYKYYFLVIFSVI